MLPVSGFLSSPPKDTSSDSTPIPTNAKKPNGVASRLFSSHPAARDRNARRSLFEKTKDAPKPDFASEEEVLKSCLPCPETVLPNSLTSYKRVSCKPAPEMDGFKNTQEVTINAADFFAEQLPQHQPKSPDTSEDFFLESPKRKLNREKSTTNKCPKLSALEKCKRPTIIDNQTFRINGQNYQVECKEIGNNHKIFFFTEEGTFPFTGCEIPLHSLILRTPCPNGNFSEILKEGIAAFHQLAKCGVPTPKCYLNPETFQDTENIKNGAFWILEKMTEKVVTTGWSSSENNTKRFDELSEKDKKVLQFVHSWLKASYEAQQELIPDFLPRNVMWDCDGELKVVDFALTKNFWLHNLQTNARGWASGNLHILEYLYSALS